MTTEYIHAIILGIIQGIAEFLPISSSGHLVIADAVLRQYSGTAAPQESTTMSIALHFGTLLSIMVVYRRELMALLSDFRLMFLIVVATIPVGVVGVAFKDQIEEIFQKPILAGCALLVTAAFLLIGRRLQQAESQTTELKAMSRRTATVIGIFQAIAIIPGISRSGSTIAAGMACGLNREHAARFSFLIAIPAIGGASVMQLKDLVTGEEVFTGSPLPLLIGAVISFVVGVITLKWLIRLLVADRLHLFARYCIVVGLLTILWQLSLHPSAISEPSTSPTAIQGVSP
ncbi:MAG: undecaprenyl-diphosphate phosphatase [Planctomycetaceae bacterium]